MTDRIDDVMICPTCGRDDCDHPLTTEEQLKFLWLYRRKFLDKFAAYYDEHMKQVEQDVSAAIDRHRGHTQGE